MGVELVLEPQATGTRKGTSSCQFLPGGGLVLKSARVVYEAARERCPSGGGRVRANSVKPASIARLYCSPWRAEPAPPSAAAMTIQRSLT